ncbi:hypothetical protein JCM4814A_73770 [Streptomyces phaeofaciens JCM 4814]|uniref:Uncharacterized protein n=1 Tax=Streptomyces phaeofaciens TaxID=68254 RepID=A0A918LWE1_9ACTN|nr:hypothetical protein [Streptomyces phaeofaciens]GGT63340.1 hypothetical protein GCM10010226_46230 [Streptomyces phaeofaciens]
MAQVWRAGPFISCQNQSTFNLVDVPATLSGVAIVATPERILLGAAGPGPNDIDTTTVNAPSNNHCG